MYGVDEAGICLKGRSILMRVRSPPAIYKMLCVPYVTIARAQNYPCVALNDFRQKKKTLKYFSHYNTLDFNTI